MSAHNFHESLPGYDYRQILHDRCGECEARGRDLHSALAYMDGDTFQRAWQRAYDAHRPSSRDEVGRVSDAEAPLLDVLYNIRMRLGRTEVLKALRDAS